MELAEYQSFLCPALELYNSRMRSYLEKELLEQGLLNRKSEDAKEVTLDYIKRTNSDTLVGCVNHLGIKAIKFFEEWEFIKNYEYSVLYEATNINQQHLLGRLTQCFSTHDEHVETLHATIKNPTFIQKEDLIILKFSLMKEAIHPQTEEKLKIKYPLVVIFYTNNNLLEIRYDSIKGFFVDDYKQFYLRNIKSIKSWITKNLEVGMENFILEKVINDIKDNTDIEIDGQDMRFSDGGTARLQKGITLSDPLPLLGDLKKLISENIEFDESIAVKQLLETWIKSKEDEADYRWISLCWPHKDGVKRKNNTVKFQFDYLEPDVCLLYHYSGPVGMERMNSVTRYIIENRDNS